MRLFTNFAALRNKDWITDHLEHFHVLSCCIVRKTIHMWIHKSIINQLNSINLEITIRKFRSYRIVTVLLTKYSSVEVGQNPHHIYFPLFANSIEPKCKTTVMFRMEWHLPVSIQFVWTLIFPQFFFRERKCQKCCEFHANFLLVHSELWKYI